MQVAGKFTYLGSMLPWPICFVEEVLASLGKACVVFSEIRGNVWDLSSFQTAYKMKYAKFKMKLPGKVLLGSNTVFHALTFARSRGRC